ncbi:MAG: aminotransferase class V-fold PLP-dependent enzyme [Candidatus Gastranaerophilaceae bacterium]|jgi:cysteine desulfurase
MTPNERTEMKVYLDNNATTKVDETVLEEILPYFSEKYENPSSLYSTEILSAVSNARKQVAKAINVNPNEIIFTSCGTEGTNLAIRGVLAEIKDKNHIITTKVEHAATLSTCQELEKQGYEVTYLNVNSVGGLDLKEFKNSITSKTALIAVMWANNETGVIFPIKEIAEITKETNPETLVFVDAVQAMGKIPIDLQSSKIDLLSFSGHKIHAPKGIGALFVRNGIKMKPIITGGHQEQSIRSGTENVAGILAIGKACEMLHPENENIRKLRDKLETGILKSCFNARINGSKENRVANTTNISFEYLESELILMELQEQGIYVSSGSACLTGSLEPSYVLSAMGLSFTQANAAIRFSLSKYTTEDEIDYTIVKVSEIINKMISLSPYENELNKIRERRISEIILRH